MMKPNLLQADDIHSPCTSETHDDATTTQGGRFIGMIEVEKIMELALDAYFYKTSKYDTKTRRSK